MKQHEGKIFKTTNLKPSITDFDKGQKTNLK